MTSPSNDLISITVEMSGKQFCEKVVLDNISLLTTVGELKEKLNMRPNARFGRFQMFENWDNRRPLTDYFVQNGESFICVIQCSVETRQRLFDDYNQWLIRRGKPKE